MVDRTQAETVNYLGEIMHYLGETFAAMLI